MRDVLRHRDLRLLLAGQAVSQAGDWLYNVALIVYVLDATGSAAWVAAVELAHLVPWIVMSPVGGLHGGPHRPPPPADRRAISSRW